MHSFAVATWLRSGRVAISGMGNCTIPQHFFYKKWPGSIDPQNFGLTSNGLIAEQRFWGANSRIVFASGRIFNMFCFWHLKTSKTNCLGIWEMWGCSLQRLAKLGKLRSFHPGWPEKTKYVKIEMSAAWSGCGPHSSALTLYSCPWVSSYRGPGAPTKFTFNWYCLCWGTPNFRQRMNMFI